MTILWSTDTYDRPETFNLPTPTTLKELLRQLAEPPAPKTPKARPAATAHPICKLPSELVQMICDYVDLGELTNLYRAFLPEEHFVKSNIFKSLWNDGFRATDLPECPTFMTEPEYAALVFVPQCSYCYARVAITSWKLRKRICKACIPLRCISLPSIAHVLGVEALEVTIKELVPHDILSIQNHSDDWFLKSDLAAFVRFVLAGRAVAQRRGYVAAIEEFQQRCLTWRSNRNGDEAHVMVARITLRIGRQDSILSRLESAGWSREEITAAQRCSSDVEDFPLLTYHPVFRECRPLTDDAWPNVLSKLNTDVLAFWRPQLADHDKAQGVVRRQKVVQRAWNVYKRGLPARSLVPTFSQICYHETVKEVIDRRYDGTLLDQELQPLVSQFGKIRYDLLHQGVRRLETLLPPRSPRHGPFERYSDEKHRHLSFASTATCIFCCELCQTSMHARAALTHFCSVEILIAQGSESSFAKLSQMGSHGELRAHWLEFDSVPVKPAGFMYYDGAASHFADIIVGKAFPGRNSHAIPCREMDSSLARFVCCACRCVRKSAVGMKWRDALAHMYEANCMESLALLRDGSDQPVLRQRVLGEVEPKWIQWSGYVRRWLKPTTWIHPEWMNVIPPEWYLGEEICTCAHCRQASNSIEAQEVWWCARCGDGPTTSNELHAHFANSHDMQWYAAKDYFISPAADDMEVMALPKRLFPAFLQKKPTDRQKVGHEACLAVVDCKYPRSKPQVLEVVVVNN